ncbi:MAG: DUF5018 domain-containing protein, partial [Prevotellaceae bacterium]|nr:DUF5018 domain-containing protein [Prevotellaceae bacterium]
AITITSNEPLKKTDDSELADGDLSSLITFKETDASGANVAFTATINATKEVITITPSSPLDNSQAYYIAIAPVADTAANITTAQSATFTTLSLSSDAEILTFVIPDQIGSSIIDADEATVTVIMPAGTDVRNLVPVITVSNYASILPLSGAAQDFTNIVEYTVTAQDGTVKVWNVSVIFPAPPPSNENLIISFTLPGQTEMTLIDNDTRTVIAPMPVGISLVDLIPSIHISFGATISPSANTMRDFSSPVTYTVTSESGISALWLVKVQQGSADEGLLFDFISGTQILHIENKTLGIGKIDIYASDGRLMYSGKRGTNSEFHNTEFNIDMSGYAGGMYIIRIWDKNYALTKTIKIIK